MRVGRLGNVLKAFTPKASPFCDHQVRGSERLCQQGGYNTCPPAPLSHAGASLLPVVRTPPLCARMPIRSQDPTKWALAATIHWLPRSLPARLGRMARAEGDMQAVPGALRPLTHTPLPLHPDTYFRERCAGLASAPRWLTANAEKIPNRQDCVHAGAHRFPPLPRNIHTPNCTAGGWST